MTPASYLVQVRQAGQPWETVASCHAQGQAEAFADVLDKQQTRFGCGPPGTTCLAFAHVRVTIHGATVYDPRARKAVRA